MNITSLKSLFGKISSDLNSACTSIDNLSLLLASQEMEIKKLNKENLELKHKLTCDLCTQQDIEYHIKPKEYAVMVCIDCYNKKVAELSNSKKKFSIIESIKNCCGFK